MADDTIAFRNDADGAEANTAAEEGAADGYEGEVEAPRFEVSYSCLRCGTGVTNTELGRLPEIKCICGYKVFTKVRQPLVKTVMAV